MQLTDFIPCFIKELHRKRIIQKTVGKNNNRICTTSIHPSVHLGEGIYLADKVDIRANVFIDDYSYCSPGAVLFKNTKIGKYCFLGAHSAVGGVSVLKDNVSIWSMAAVNKDLVIAEGTTILAYSAVDKDTEPGVTYFGLPAEEVKKKWKELASLRSLPDIISQIKK